jgi:hypothetical protein
MRHLLGTFALVSVTLGALAVIAVAGGCKFPALPDITDAANETDGDVATDASIDVPTSCTPNTTTCTGQLLTVCNAEGSPTNTVCNFGCASSNDRCLDLAPSNGLATYLDQSAAAQPLTLTGNASINTSTGVVMNGDGSTVTVTSTMLSTTPVGTMVISARALDVGNVTVRGSRALAIVVDGDAMFRGTFSGSATKFTPGPGSSLLPECNAGNGAANTMSLQHAVFEWRGDRLWCRDTGSTNGTQANRQPQHDWFTVSSGMRLDFGDVAVIAMDWRLTDLCQPLAWCLGLEAHADIDHAISTIQGGGPLVLIGPRHNDQEWLARKIHDASERREYPFTPLTTRLRGTTPLLTGARFGSVFVDLAAVGKVTAAFARELFAGESPHLLVRPIIAAPSHIAVQRAFQQLGEAQSMVLPSLEQRKAEAVRLIEVLLKENKSAHKLKDLGDLRVERLAQHEWANLGEIREAERRIRAVLETANRTQAAARLGTSRQALNKFLARIFGS